MTGMIIATAGHIDHGKTQLVKALTGIDADRLPQERDRGISIDLGFASLALPRNACIHFIDVPGHERFIRNMIAGVGKIDAALLVIAADDGIMPQTREHLQILDLLGVDRGAAVITKTDRASTARVEAVISDTMEILAGTALQEAPVFPVSALQGCGLERLLEWLDGLESTEPAHSPQHAYFRLPADRVFTMPGSGTVVTGTVHSGYIQPGEHVLISPSGTTARVRSIQRQGQTVDSAMEGQRCALNLANVGVAQIARGDWIVQKAIHAPTQRLDARIRVLESCGCPLEHGQSVHLHHGTTAATARISIVEAGHIPAGGSGFMQLHVQQPLAALYGDRFIIRNVTSGLTLGGGIILNPFAPPRRRSGGLYIAELQARERPSPEGILAGLMDLNPGGINLESFAIAMNLKADRAAQVQDAAHVMPLGGAPDYLGISRGTANILASNITSVIRTFHHQKPQAPGIDIDSLRLKTQPRLPPVPFRAFLRLQANRQQLRLSNDTIRLNDHDATSNPEDERLWQRVYKQLESAGAETPVLSKLAVDLHINEQTLRDFMHRKARSGELWRISDTRFCLRTILESLAETAVVVASRSEDGLFSAGDYRDAIGTGRRLAILYLEFFDRAGLTQRFGEQRRISGTSLFLRHN